MRSERLLPRSHQVVSNLRVPLPHTVSSDQLRKQGSVRRKRLAKSALWCKEAWLPRSCSSWQCPKPNWWFLMKLTSFWAGWTEERKSVGLLSFWLVVLIAMSITSQKNMRPTDFGIWNLAVWNLIIIGIEYQDCKLQRSKFLCRQLKTHTSNEIPKFQTSSE